MELVEIKNTNETNIKINTLTKAAKFDTREDRIYAFKNAETIVDSFFVRERSGAVSSIRAEALMTEKKDIMGDLWRENLSYIPIDLKDKWFAFLKEIGEIDKNGKQSRYVLQLLAFANYKESAKLKGIKIVAPNEMQIRKLSPLMNKKKSNKKKNMIDASIMYELLAKEMNNGEPFSTSESVVIAFEEYHKKPKVEKLKEVKTETKEETTSPEMIYVRHIFEEEAGECPDRGKNTMALGGMVLDKMPETSAADWKKWYHKVSRCLHPDHGGTDGDMAILVSVNNMIEVVISEQKKNDIADEWISDYEQWKEDHGYDNDFVSEDEV